MLWKTELKIRGRVKIPKDLLTEIDEFEINGLTRNEEAETTYQDENYITLEKKKKNNSF